MKSQLLSDTNFTPFTHLKVKIWAILLPYPLYFGPEIGSCGVYNGNIETAIKKMTMGKSILYPKPYASSSLSLDSLY